MNKKAADFKLNHKINKSDSMLRKCSVLKRVKVMMLVYISDEI